MQPLFMLVLISLALAALSNPLPPQLFVIFSHERTGSNFFCTDLSEKLLMYNVSVHYELFNKKHIWANPSTKQANILINYPIVERNRNGGYFMRRVRQHAIENGYWATGFKIFPRQTSSKLPHAWLANPDTVKIIYYRPKVLDVYISLRKALQTNNWINHNTTGQKVPINQQHFLTFVNYYEAWFETAKRRSRGPTLIITYEEYSKSPESRAEIAARIYNELVRKRGNGPVYGPRHITASDVIERHSTVPKQNHDSTWDSIENAEEVRGWICGMARFAYLCQAEASLPELPG